MPPLRPTFDGKEFDTMFRILKPRFMQMMSDFAVIGDPYYVHDAKELLLNDYFRRNKRTKSP